MNWTQIIIALISALVGGGIVRFSLIPEKKASAKLDNAERLVVKYEDILSDYKKQINDLKEEVELLRNKCELRDHKISDLEQRISSLKYDLDSQKTRRGADGRFKKHDAVD